jgi:hypothetical protein
MFFYTNPFNDESFSENHQNDIKITMKCEVFIWTDFALEQTEFAVLHFYLDSELDMTNNVELEDIGDSMFINGTELNE